MKNKKSLVFLVLFIVSFVLSVGNSFATSEKSPVLQAAKESVGKEEKVLNSLSASFFSETSKSVSFPSVGVSDTSLKSGVVSGAVSGGTAGVITGSDIYKSSADMLWARNGDNIYNTNIGNVGIGTTNPSEKLTVNGNIYTTGQLSLGGTLIGASSNVLNIGAFGVAISNPSALTYLDLENVATVRVQATAGGESSIGTKDDADFSIRTNDTKRITISRDGNVGIGTTNPGAKLDVAGDIKAGAIKVYNLGVNTDDVSGVQAHIDFPLYKGAAEALRLSNSGITPNSVYLSFYPGGSEKARIVGHSSGSLFFGTNGSGNQMVINSLGNVGIGTTNPTAKLEVAGDLKVSDGNLSITKRGKGLILKAVDGESCFLINVLRSGALSATEVGCQ